MNPEYADLHVPPHNIDAEQSVLGGLMLDGSKWDVVAPLLAEHDFYRADHQLIFRSMSAMVETSVPIDWLMLGDWLQDRDLLDDAGGSAYLGTLAKDTPSAANVAHYAGVVREKSHRRQLIALLNDMSAMAMNEGDVSAPELMKVVQDKVYKLSEAARLKKTAWKTSKDLAKELIEEWHRQQEMGQQENGLLGQTTGLTEVNNMLRGLLGGQLVVVAGATSMGKSALAQTMDNAALNDGIPTLLINMEMSSIEVAQRMVANRASVPMDHVRSIWNIQPESESQLYGAMKPLAGLPWYVVAGEGMSPDEIKSIAMKVDRECHEKHGRGLGRITVDYLQLMVSAPGARHDTRAGEVGTFSRGLKSLAKLMDIPVIALSQLNREVERRPNKRPVKSDLRESGSIEHDADIILFVYRDEYYNPDTTDVGVAEVTVAKQRQGETGTVKVAFQGKYARFANLAYQDYVEGFDESYT